MWLLDEAVDRKAAAHVAAVEAVRMGLIFGSSADGQKQYDRWRKDATRKPVGRSLAQMARDLGVVRGGFEFRTA